MLVCLKSNLIVSNDPVFVLKAGEGFFAKGEGKCKTK